MPYLAHFGLREHPFFLSPTPDHFFPASQSLQLLQLLEQAILRNGGLIKLVGPVSSGKTLAAHLLAQRLMQRSDTPAEVALVTAAQTQGPALIRDICRAFGVAEQKDTKPLEQLGTFLVAQQAAGTVCVLVIDEAQTLGLGGLETAQMLSELASEHGRLLHVVLVGQSALDAMLAAKPMQRVRQAIAFSFSTAPFTPEETRDYITRRIAGVRESGATRDVFDNKALDLIVQASSGVPGSIIVLCDKAMRVAQEQGFRTVNRTHVQTAMLNCPSLAQIPAAKSHSGWAWAAGIGGALVGAVVAATVLMSPTAREALRTWAGYGESPVADASAVPSPAEGNDQVQAEGIVPPQAAASAPDAAPPVTDSQRGEMETQSTAVPAPTVSQTQTPVPTPVPASETGTASASASAPAPAPAPAPAMAVETAPVKAPVSAPVAENKPPVVSVAKPTAPQKPVAEAPVVAPTKPAAKPEAPAKPVVAAKPAAPVVAVKPAPAAPKPAAPKPAVAKPAPVVSAPASPASASSAPASSAPASSAPASSAVGQKKARLTANGTWVWE